MWSYVWNMFLNLTTTHFVLINSKQTKVSFHFKYKVNERSLNSNVRKLKITTRNKTKMSSFYNISIIYRKNSCFNLLSLLVAIILKRNLEYIFHSFNFHLSELLFSCSIYSTKRKKSNSNKMNAKMSCFSRLGLASCASNASSVFYKKMFTFPTFKSEIKTPQAQNILHHNLIFQT